LYTETLKSTHQDTAKTNCCFHSSMSGVQVTNGQD